jgi:hypothetical protein
MRKLEVNGSKEHKSCYEIWWMKRVVISECVNIEIKGVEIKNMIMPDHQIC